jgi:glucose/arabinose dehydrogenase
VSTQLTPVADIDQPIDLTMRPGDDTTIYVAQRTGTIVKLNAGTVSDPILDLSAETTTDAERGLLGIAFSADGSFLYVNFTDRNGASHVEEFAVDRTGNPDSSTRRLLLTQDQPYRNHNGGGIVVGPDGMLYIGFGDGGSAGDPERRALRADTWLGKLLRIDPRAGDETRPYGIPNDNPFVGTPGVLPEIWSLGLRNPWRFSFDPSTGDLWIGDVGQNEWEEVDWAPASSGAGRGVSFGWSAFEATHRYNDDQPSDGHVLPVFEYPHGSMGVSVTGGVVYRGTALPALRGAYVYGDYGFNGLRAIALAGDSVRTEVTLAEGARTVVDIDAGPDGEIYVAALEQGQVLRLDPA